MSYLDQFLKETNSTTQQQINTYDNLPVQNILYKGGSIESEEGDIEDNRALSMTSSKSNLSELSTVSLNAKCPLKIVTCISYKQSFNTNIYVNK